MRTHAFYLSLCRAGRADLTNLSDRTLALRLKRAQQTAMLLAERLASHPQVACVRYPGLPAHPTHAVARRVLKGVGTIISFDLAGGAEVADAVCRRISLSGMPPVSAPWNPL